MKRNMAKSIDRIAKLVREEKRLGIVKFCDVLNLSPSSFYNYRKFVTARYHDIIYENGEFVLIESEER
ncbi:DNA-binding repressor [Nitrososphaeria virus YSH_462411]|uniref:DNA-binding repressor n=1 Tax=Nitrososphaeria virus YSH_462411 TaxID=3071321 RepID=A0A976UAI5_9CAUD|nr:DNA-binding repressor [Yangshan Harbor Nitrososphaeria virus]UVF62328.1 DNA-binding repressor [Nitrososphaeria virus YSH_462411]